MQDTRLISAAVAMILILAGCEKPADETPAPEPPYAETEKMIRTIFDPLALYTWNEYHMLMEKLCEDKFTVLPLNEMRIHSDPSKVVVGLRHDVDVNPFKALEMAEIERTYGVRSTYFILATSEYYWQISSSGISRNTGMDSLYKRISNKGAEIGIHNDLLTVMITFGRDPDDFNNEELSFYRSIGIPIHGTASHGSLVSKATVPNFSIFSEFTDIDSVRYNGVSYPVGLKTLHEFGFQYESYFIDYDTYISDSGGLWNVPGGIYGVLDKLEASQPGARIQILVHPDWWGKKIVQ